MRYTRYEYKKYSKLKFLFSIVVIATVSIGGGLYISNFVFDKNKVSQVQSMSVGNSDSNKEIEGSINIIALQCGYYANKENADKSINALVSYCSPFIIENEGKFRVIAGIYREEEADKKFDELASNGIEVTKIKLIINGENSEDKKCIEIMDGFFTILNKLEEDDVKSIKTEDFKKWTKNIIGNDKVSDYKKLNQINECINNFPEEINKNNRAEISAEIYKIINVN